MGHHASKAAQPQGAEVELVIGRAQETAQWDDFGAEGWREGLGRSLDAFARMPLKPDVREQALAKVEQDLVTRLRVEKWYAEHPEIADVAIEGPVVVVGLPRTGTTATVGMLALDERFRFLRAWEGHEPVPPPIAGEEVTDERLIRARREAAEYEMSHMHLSDPDGPEEDMAILAGLDMHAMHGALPMPDDYTAWWLQEDMASYYAYLERVLKLLQSRRPPRLWLLKSPPHLFRLEAIHRQFPNARFVMTHRDPVKVIGSVASLYSALYEKRCVPGNIDPHTVGRNSLELWVEGMRRGLAARDAIGDDRFIDLKNDDVVKRPIETFERLYAFLGMAFDEPLRTRVDAYNKANAPGAFGKHSYAPEDFGLTSEGIRNAFAEYVARFGV